MNTPQRKHPERQVGESYRDALDRVAGERDAAEHDIARFRVQVTDMRTLADVWERRAENLVNLREGRSKEEQARRETVAGTLLGAADQIRRVLDAHLLPVGDYDGEVKA
jgi:hypothetical protein